MKRRNELLAPTIMVIFGGSGDLAKRKLLPALINLNHDQYLPSEFAVLGLGRTDHTDQSFRDEIRKGIDLFSRRKIEEDHWLAFRPRIKYLKSNILDAASYEDLKATIQDIQSDWSARASVIYYLAIAPHLVETVAKNLGLSKLCTDIDKTRLVVEKPFGDDLESARHLNDLLKDIFDESQLYRIDHYLGKEAVQNLLVFRFANTLFEPIWNSKYIDHVQITVSEKVGVGDRGGYYDKSGALKDMIQNHVLQLLCFTAMEAPVSFDADEIRNKKLDVLKAIQSYSGKDIFTNSARGQYDRPIDESSSGLSYREEEKVDDKSSTETFAAIKFYVANWRWQNVPFYVRSGKNMPQKLSKIVIQFKPVPHQVFDIDQSALSPNRITISIAPETGLKVSFQAKRVGQEMRLKQEDLTFNYSEDDGKHQPEAYETLLHDVLIGDATLFMRSDEVEAAWRVVMPFVEAWEDTIPSDFPNYPARSWGPESAARLIAADGRHWIK